MGVSDEIRILGLDPKNINQEQVAEKLKQLNESKDDLVKHPKHYNKGIECWDYVESHNMGFSQGNVVKYVTRYKHRDGLKDLKKAKEYLEKLIDIEEKV